MSRHAFGRQLRNELLERKILMAVGSQGPLSHLTQERTEIHVAGENPAQHYGIEEEADEGFRFAACPPGNRRPHQDVVLAGIAMKHGHEAGFQSHEQRCLLSPAQRLQRFQQFLREIEELRSAAEALHRGA